MNSAVDLDPARLLKQLVERICNVVFLANDDVESAGRCQRQCRATVAEAREEGPKLCPPRAADESY